MRIAFTDMNIHPCRQNHVIKWDVDKLIEGICRRPVLLTIFNSPEVVAMNEKKQQTN